MEQIPGEWYYNFSSFNEIIFNPNFETNLNKKDYNNFLLNSEEFDYFCHYIESNNYIGWTMGFIDERIKQRCQMLIDFYSENLENLNNTFNNKDEIKYNKNQLRQTSEYLENINCSMSKIFYSRQIFIRGIELNPRNLSNKNEIYESLRFDHEVYMSLLNNEKSKVKYVGNINFLYSILAFLKMFPRMLMEDQVKNQIVYVLEQNRQLENQPLSFKLLNKMLIIRFISVRKKLINEFEEILEYYQWVQNEREFDKKNKEDSKHLLKIKKK